MPSTYSWKKLLLAGLPLTEVEQRLVMDNPRRARLQYDHQSKPTLGRDRTEGTAYQSSPPTDRSLGEPPRLLPSTDDHSSQQSQCKLTEPGSRRSAEHANSLPRDDSDKSSDENVVIAPYSRRLRRTVAVSGECKIDSEVDSDLPVRRCLASNDGRNEDISLGFENVNVECERRVTSQRRAAAEALASTVSSSGATQFVKNRSLTIHSSDSRFSKAIKAKGIVTHSRRLRRQVTPGWSLIEDNSGESEEEPVVSISQRRGKRHLSVVVNSTESEEELVISSPKRRRQLEYNKQDPRLQTTRRFSPQQRLDLEEDLQVLQDSVLKNTRTRGILAGSGTARRQKHLEILCRWRAGGKRECSLVEENEYGAEPRVPPEDDDGDAQADRDIRQLKLRDDSDVESPVLSDADLDRYEDDFVLQDDEVPLGVPTGLSIPVLP